MKKFVKRDNDYYELVAETDTDVCVLVPLPYERLTERKGEIDDTPIECWWDKGLCD